MPLALFALTAGAFGIGVTEFVIMGLLLEVGASFGVSVSTAGLLISGYALGVVVGAPLLTALTQKWPRKTVLLALMAIFIIGNLASALAPTYALLMIARVITSFAHGSFFGIGSVVATGLVPENKKASAIAIMFTGLTVATILGVPFGTWLGQLYGWRATFWAVTLIGIAAFAVIALLVPKSSAPAAESSLKNDLAMLARPSVGLGLLTTILGYAGVFAIFTYIAPMLTEITGFSDSIVSPAMLVFGVGLLIGNLAGGKLADRWLKPTLIGSLGVLALTSLAMTFALHDQIAAIAFVGLLGATGFATVSPLQMWVLKTTEGAGQSLASSLNIAAFNLGNALGAWLGGVVIDHGPGLGAIPAVAALVTLAGIGIATLSLRAGTPARMPIAAAQPKAC
jgi:MFS transporter, DHA1 family, inner membrane transport protein